MVGLFFTTKRELHCCLMQEFVPSYTGAAIPFTASDALCIQFGQIAEAAFTQALSIEHHSACVWSVTSIQRSRKGRDGSY